MYCARCNKNFPSGQFCPECGTSLLAAPTQVSPVAQVVQKAAKRNRKPLILIGAGVLAVILIGLGIKISGDIATNDAKDSKIGKALETCGLAGNSGVQILDKRIAILSDDGGYLGYSDMACVIAAVGGPSSSDAYQLVSDEYSSDTYYYGDVTVVMSYESYVTLVEIKVQ